MEHYTLTLDQLIEELLELREQAGTGLFRTPVVETEVTYGKTSRIHFIMA